MPAHQTHARFALINNVSILESRLGFWDFFHDLGRIHVSLFRLPRCSKVMYLGLVVLVLSLTSAQIARLSPQVWLPAVLGS